MSKRYLLVNITDLASPKGVMGFSLLTNGVPMIGYILDKKDILSNLLVLEYESVERVEATCEILNKQGIRAYVKQSIRREILPLNLEGLSFSTIYKRLLKNEV